MKNKILSTLAILLVLGSFVAKAQSLYTFTDFDYPKETVTWGSHSKISYFIPVDKAQLLEENELHLDFKVSDVLDIENSFVTLVVADVPVATKSPDNTDYTLSFTFPFDAEDVVSGFLKVDVINNFHIDNICEIQNESAFWIRRLDSSYIKLDYNNLQSNPQDIANFIPKISYILGVRLQVIII